MASKSYLASLARAADGGIISTAAAADAWGITRSQASERLAGLHERGWIVRLRRGLYHILPVEAAAAGQTTVEDPWILAMALYHPGYIGGWSAAEHWGLTEQLFRSTFVVTSANVRDRNPTMLGAAFHVVKVSPARIRGADSIWRGSTRVRISNPERTLVDALRRPAWVGGVRHLAEILNRYLTDHPSDMKALRSELLRQRSGAAFKRAGYLLEESLGELPDGLADLPALVSAGTIKLDPDLPELGTISTRWGLRINSRVI